MKTALIFLFVLCITIGVSGQGVGIGTTTPNAQLELGSTLANRKIILYEGVVNDHQFSGFGINAGLMRYQVADATNAHVFYAATSSINSTELMRIKGDGKVGIGITNPLNNFDVTNGPRTGTHGSGLPLYITGAMGLPENGVVEFRRLDGQEGIGIGYNTIYAAGSDPSQSLILKAKGSEGHLRMNTNGLERMRVTSEGAVGIGLTSPGNKLDVTNGPRTGIHGSGLPLYITGAMGLAENGVVEFRRLDGQEGIGIGFNTIYAAGSDISQSLTLKAKGSEGHLRLYANGSERMRVTADGNVGIGTTSPYEKLELTGTGRAFFGDGGGANRKGLLIDGVEPTGARIEAYDYTTGSGTDLSLNVFGGDVGIAMSNPANKLDIQKEARTGTHATGRPLYVTGPILDASNGVEIRHSNGTQGIGFGSNTIYAAGTNADQNLGMQAKGPAGNLLMTTNGTERMRVTASGNVGIGTLTPAHKLDVNGDARIQGVLKLGYDITTFNTEIPNGGDYYPTCYCDVINQKVVGGGWQGPNLNVFSSYPAADGSGWIIGVNNVVPFTTTPLTVYAICARIEE